MADAKFSAAAATGCLVVVIATAARGAWVPAALFGALTVGFLVRAGYGYRSRR